MNSAFFFIVIIVFSMVGCRPCVMGTDEEISQCLAQGPREELRKVPQLERFLTKHKVYVSLTSSPKRISKIPLVLRTLDLNLIEKIFVALPEKYRDEQPYEISDELRNFPKVEILQGGRDLGPIMKLLPATRKVQEMGDDEAIVITVDDDTGYAIGLLATLVKQAIIHRTVVGSRGDNLENWGISSKLWPQSQSRHPGCFSGHDLSYCDVLEGFGAVAYPVKWVDVDVLTNLSQLSKACKTSDDIVISFSLALNSVPAAVWTSRYIPDSRQIVQFKYGFEDDALHRGSGYLDSLVETSTNNGRYQACVNDINKWLKSEEKR